MFFLKDQKLTREDHILDFWESLLNCRPDPITNAFRTNIADMALVRVNRYHLHPPAIVLNGRSQYIQMSIYSLSKYPIIFIPILIKTTGMIKRSMETNFSCCLYLLFIRNLANFSHLLAKFLSQDSLYAHRHSCGGTWAASTCSCKTSQLSICCSSSREQLKLEKYFLKKLEKHRVESRDGFSVKSGN